MDEQQLTLTSTPKHVAQAQQIGCAAQRASRPLRLGTALGLGASQAAGPDYQEVSGAHI